MLFLVGLVLAVIGQTTGLFERLDGRGEHIARVELDGFIDFDDAFVDLLEDLEDDDDVKAVILEINSPGGIAVAGETIYSHLRELAKPSPWFPSLKASARRLLLGGQCRRTHRRPQRFHRRIDRRGRAVS